MAVGVIRSIEEHPFFAGWTGRDLVFISKTSEELHYKSGEIIVDINEEEYGCFFILDGEVSILAKMEGRLTEVDHRGPGETFGEIAMITQEPYFVRVVACSECTMGYIPFESIRELVGSIPVPLSKLLRATVRHLGKMSVCLAEKSVHREKMAVVGCVVNDVVNDFRSPAQMIGLGVEAIGQLSRDRQVKKICSSITDQVTKIMEMASELAVFARGEAEFRFIRVNLREFMEEFRQQNLKIFQNCDLEIVIDVPDIDMDIEKLSMHKALRNLLNNAVFTMNGRSGHITITAKAIGDSKIEISFKDDGKGIPEAIRKNCWEPFITSETGLGMSVVKGVVECHGGEINIDEDTTVGTNFVMVLPRFHVTGG